MLLEDLLKIHEENDVRHDIRIMRNVIIQNVRHDIHIKIKSL